MRSWLIVFSSSNKVGPVLTNSISFIQHQSPSGYMPPTAVACISYCGLVRVCDEKHQSDGHSAMNHVRIISRFMTQMFFTFISHMPYVSNGRISLQHFLFAELYASVIVSQPGVN